jgi:hypothetical protein
MHLVDFRCRETQFLELAHFGFSLDLSKIEYVLVELEEAVALHRVNDLAVGPLDDGDEGDGQFLLHAVLTIERDDLTRQRPFLN